MRGELKSKLGRASCHKRELITWDELSVEKYIRLINKIPKAVTEPTYKKPRTIGDVSRLLGLLACYRRDVKKFAKIAQLLDNLHDLLKESPSVSDMSIRKQNSTQLILSGTIVFKSHHQETLNQLENAITPPSVLRYPNY